MGKLISVKQFDAYWWKIAGKDNVKFSAVSSNRWQEVHLREKIETKPTYYIINGIFERMPSNSCPNNTDINYLAGAPKQRDSKFNDNYRGTVLKD
eukprot:10239714-Ditylum_brightwellii.AAC.1